MRVCSFRGKGEPVGSEKAGVVESREVRGLEGGHTLAEVLVSGRGLQGLRPSGKGHALSDVMLGPPLRRPGKILATIVNTQGMLGGKDVVLGRPRLDMKAPSTVIGPGEAIQCRGMDIRPEVELGAVVGRRISRATKEEARTAIIGFTIVNDVTAPKDSKDDAYEAYRRDKASGEIRKGTLRGPLFRSKNHDTFCPMGPWLVTPDELDDVSALGMRTTFDGELVQSGSTSEYLFEPAEIASYVSVFLTLEPGDVVSCGSVGWTEQALGSMDPTEYVLPRRAGTLRLEVEGIGTLSNPVELG